MIRTPAVAEPRVHTGKVFHQQSLIFFLSGRMKHYYLCYSKKNQSMNCLNVITSLSVRMQKRSYLCVGVNSDPLLNFLHLLLVDS